jgi:hypothetical protein
MEHVCRSCNTEWFDNNPGGACPECESANVAHYFDEEDDAWYDDDDDDGDDGDDDWEDHD